MIHRVAVVTGGSTPERDVALAGARQVVDALRALDYDVTVIDTVRGTLKSAQEDAILGEPVTNEPPSQAELDRLRGHELGPKLTEVPALRNADVAFLVLHGRQGEGGEIQALLDLADICYTGSGPVGSAIALDKDIAKRIFRDAGLPTPKWELWPAPRDKIEQLGLPLIIKPSRVGSTVGLTLIRSWDEFDDALELALRFDSDVLLEEYVRGRELTVGILGDQALSVGEIVAQHEIFDYECKYTPGMAQEIFPADVSADVTTRVQAAGHAAHVALKLRDFSRVDFLLTPAGTLHCLEANTLPGLTSTSLLPKSARGAGIPFAEMCQRICADAYRRATSGNKVRA